MVISRSGWTGAAVAAVLSIGITASPSMAQRLPSGTSVPVRTSEAINVSADDGQVFSGVIDQNIVDANGNVVIPEGSSAEMVVRKTTGNELTLDLDSIVVNGQRYSVAADQNTVGTSGTIENGTKSIGKNKDTATYIGGGALLGAIIGAVAGGGKGAAIGAATGAGAGAATQIIVKGRSVSVPAESLVTFRLAQGFTVPVNDTGFQRNGRHYHRY
jgi:hypothetical protein